LNPPSPQALLAFVRAAELGSFAAAAQHLDMSSAAVGQAVQRLERHYGVRLLHRTTRRMTLTHDGRALATRCRSLLDELDEIGRAFDESRRQVAGPLRISAPVGFGRRHVLPLVAQFMAAHPQAQVTLDLTDAMRDFSREPVDVAFRVLRPTDSSIIARPISRLQAVTVASREYLRRHGTPAHPRDIEEHACLAYRHPTTGNLAPFVFRVGGRDVAWAPRPAMIVNDVEAGCEAAALGLGIAQPPSDYAAPFLLARRLVPILSRFRATPWTLYVCYPDAKHVPFRVRAFVEFARLQLGRDRFALPHALASARALSVASTR
jgi:DNA-binding transcriptional LysR family regulator